MLRHALIGVGLVAVALVACDPADDATVVEMYDDLFEPAQVQVAPGQPIRFENVGRVPHNAIELAGAWTTGQVVGPSEDAVITIDEPGVYDYYCSFHGTQDGEGMTGTIIVGDGSEADAPDAEEAVDERVEGWTGTTRHVPDDHETIQAAVDAAEPGDLVLVAPGTYREQVEVTTPSLTIRGEDRNDVVVDGEQTREMGIIITADGVAVENLTVRDALTNGVYWRGVTGFRGSYLTAIGNVKYGIYAFDSTDGLFEHSYASGSADAGYYIGQCRPCRAILTDLVAEYNALGYSGTNAGGDLYLVNSLWQHNGAGIVPNTLDSQRDPPARHPTLVGNIVRDNGEPGVPFLGGTWPAFGNGIVLAGVREAVVERNLVIDNPYHGIVLVPNIDQTPVAHCGQRRARQRRPGLRGVEISRSRHRPRAATAGRTTTRDGPSRGRSSAARPARACVCRGCPSVQRSPSRGTSPAARRSMSRSARPHSRSPNPGSRCPEARRRRYVPPTTCSTTTSSIPMRSGCRTGTARAPVSPTCSCSEYRS